MLSCKSLDPVIILQGVLFPLFWQIIFLLVLELLTVWRLQFWSHFRLFVYIATVLSLPHAQVVPRSKRSVDRVWG